MYPYSPKSAYDISDERKRYYEAVCECLDREGSCKPEYYKDPTEYGLIVASIAIDDEIISASDYEKIKVYARAYYRSKTIKIEVA